MRVVLSAVLSLALLATAPLRGQSPDVWEVTVSAMQAEQIAASGGVVAALFHNAVGERYLLVFRPASSIPLRFDRTNGCRLAPLDEGVPPSVATDGRRVVVFPGLGEQLLVYSVDTELWRPIHLHPRIVGRLQLAAGSAWAFGEDGARQVVARVRLDEDGSNAALLSPPIPGAVDPQSLVVVGTRVAVSSRSDSLGYVWDARSGETWRRVALPSHSSIVSVSDDRIVAATGGNEHALFSAAALDVPLRWREIYRTDRSKTAQSNGPRHTREGRIGLLERNSAGVLEVVAFDGHRDTPICRTSVPSPSSDSEDTWTFDAAAFVRIVRDKGRFMIVSSVMPEAVERWGVPASSPSPLLSGRSLGLNPAARSSPPGPQLGGGPTPPSGHADRALAWLSGRLGPDIPTSRGKARFLTSYEGSAAAGWVYDASLAAIAFCGARKHEEARAILTGLAHIQDADGAWSFSYDAARGAPDHSPRYVGSIAWVVMAINFYEAETGDRSFASAAHAALAYISQFRQTSPPELEGAVSMGTPALREISTEHNIDAFSAFWGRAELDGRQDYQAIADGLRRFVLTQLAVTGNDGRRYFKVGYRDRTLFLDAQTWTTLSLAPTADTVGPFEEAIGVALRDLREHGGRSGSVDGISGFNNARSAVEGAKVWSEGTEGMVAALFALAQRTGREDYRNHAEFYHAETARYQTATGGIPYSTENEDGWSTQASVAGTAWFILNSLTPPRNPYHPWREGRGAKQP